MSELDKAYNAEQALLPVEMKDCEGCQGEGKIQSVNAPGIGVKCQRCFGMGKLTTSPIYFLHQAVTSWRDEEITVEGFRKAILQRKASAYLLGARREGKVGNFIYDEDLGPTCLRVVVHDGTYHRAITVVFNIKAG